MCADCTLPLGQVTQPVKYILASNLPPGSTLGSTRVNIPPGLTVSSESTSSGSVNIIMSGTPTQNGIYAFTYSYVVACCPTIGIVCVNPSGCGSLASHSGKVEIATCIPGESTSMIPGIKFIPIPIDNNTSVTIPVFPKGLPRNPGSAGDMTVAGVKTAVSGVRDDVVLGIAAAYPNNVKARNALLAQAKYFQSIIENPTNTALIASAAAYIGGFEQCFKAAVGQTTSHNGWGIVGTLTVSTVAREQALAQAGAAMTGLYTSTPPLTVTCQ